METRIEELKRKLHIAEQNYKETRADAYLIEQHQLKEKIAAFEREKTVSSAPSDKEQPAAPAQSAGTVEFQPTTNIEELPSAVTRYLMATDGDKINGMGDKEIASRQKALLVKSRAFYEEQNDPDALARLESMIEKADAIIGNTDENDDEQAPDEDEEGATKSDEGADGGQEGEEANKQPTEAQETTQAAPEKPKPSKSTNGGKKSSSKGKSKGGSKKK